MSIWIERNLPARVLFREGAKVYIYNFAFVDIKICHHVTWNVLNILTSDTIPFSIQNENSYKQNHLGFQNVPNWWLYQDKNSFGLYCKTPRISLVKLLYALLTIKHADGITCLHPRPHHAVPSEWRPWKLLCLGLGSDSSCTGWALHPSCTCK